MFLFLACLFVAAIVLFAVIHRDRRPRIYFAAESGDTNALAQYLALGSNVNTPVVCYIYGARTAPLLQIASGSGQPGAVDFLLKHGANPNLRDSMGDTPLLSVVGWKDEAHLDALRILLKAGTDPEFKSSSGFWTPLICAADLGNAESVKCLLSAGADVHATNSVGLTALHYAENAEVAKLLIAAGARRTNRAWTETPAEAARRLGHLSALSVLTNASSQTKD
ncbi:MAG: ankyrin repeat domain-containing protein [Limisphaerales bacterium]